MAAPRRPIEAVPVALLGGIAVDRGAATVREEMIGKTIMV
jgi:hypothetical protein